MSEGRLAELFNELGWDHPTHGTRQIEVDGEHFELKSIADKRGVAIFQCSPNAEGQIPLHAIQRKIQKQAEKVAYEHLLIFVDSERATQTWRWASRLPGQPETSHAHTWRKGTSGEALRQKLEAIVWPLEQDEAITLTRVLTGLRHAFAKDSVSRRFYEHFKSEHKRFAGFIEGLESVTEKTWYASLMLSRLMFVYFIQCKGFLDKNANYLDDKLREVQQKEGGDQFHSFYRIFLRRMFHEGLGAPKSRRTAELGKLVGDIPYLNGGLFDPHQLEEANPDIDIPDEAFENLLLFFKQYDWHLDDRPTARDDEINPDVLGHIFEQHINQKEKGAYYTPEDVTGYISQNTVITHLLQKAQKDCEVAFEGEGSVWNLLKENPDRYLYPAVQAGVIAPGGEVVSPETALDHEAGVLPAETRPEYLERRKRCLAIRQKMASGEVRSIDDLITLNLDIRQFMLDVIETCLRPELLRAIWRAIVGRAHSKGSTAITILDPTCGSGAFLFAALNVLEPLYEACLHRMESFNEDADKLGKTPDPDFVEILKEVGKHPSRRYFIYKSIILHSLYGVDIMPEAVEICKLRLFLKLVSQVEDKNQLEPLPDLDFNIRTGNALLGYATEEQFDLSHHLLSESEDIKASIADLADGFKNFRTLQTDADVDTIITPEDKRKLRDKLRELSESLDEYLAREHGLDPSDKSFDREFAWWREEHKPFHWFADFYSIMDSGGFDVIIGNPPYISAKKVDHRYSKDYETAACPDIYAWCLERVTAIANGASRTGMIVPLSISFDKNFSELRALIYEKYRQSWFSHYDRGPQKLFVTTQGGIRNTIHIGQMGAGNRKEQHSSRIHRWVAEARSYLFTTLSYSRFNPSPWNGRIPKLNTQNLIDAWERLLRVSRKSTGMSLSKHCTESELRFKKTAYNWLSFLYEDPPCFNAEGHAIPQTAFGSIFFDDTKTRDIAFLLLNGKLQFAFWVAIGDSFHVPRWTFSELPMDLEKIDAESRKILLTIAPELRDTIKTTLQYKLNIKKIGAYNLAKCRHITDRSDAVLARIFGLGEVWEDIELLCAQMIRTDFSEADE